MKSFALVCLVMFAAACGGKHKSDSTTTAGTGGGMGPNGEAMSGSDDMVDPTIPSWAPKACIAYHRAVTQALACDAIEQATRDQIKTDYDTASDAWKAEQDATAEKISEVETACKSSTETVRADIGTNCVP